MLLAGTLVVSTAGARPVQGFIEADSPVTLEGDLQTQIADPTLLIENPETPTRILPILLWADNLTITRHVYEVRSAEPDNPVEEISLEVPPRDTSTETYTVENATIEVTGLGPDTDLLLGPSQEGPFVATVDDQVAPALAKARPGGLEILDGYREMYPENPNSSTLSSEDEFYYRYAVDEDLVVLEDTSSFQLAGRATSYVWDAHVLVRNQTGTIGSFETGFRESSSNMGTTQEEHYEYVTMELHGLNASLEPTGLQAQLMAPAMQVDLTGTITLDDPSGSLTSDDGVYRSGTRSQATVDGNVSVSLTPKTDGPNPSRLSVGVTGGVSETSLTLVEVEPLMSAGEIVAASAGGATVLGLAAWYVASAKGAGLAAIPLVGSARQQREDDEAAETSVASPDEPGHLLFDPDRFTLYHLVRSRVGLSPEECENLTGIQDAGEQLDLLAEHGLLRVMSDQPRRYCVPGTVDEGMAERIVFLRRPEARRLGELLAVHGLTPEAQLEERARRTDGPLKSKRVGELVQEFVRVGLAYREAGEEGYVVDPTDDLFACFERMGEGAVPKVS